MGDRVNSFLFLRRIRRKTIVFSIPFMISKAYTSYFLPAIFPFVLICSVMFIFRALFSPLSIETVTLMQGNII